MKKLKVAVLISGRGSNLQALINACKLQHFPAEIVLTLSNKPNVQGLVHASNANIPTHVIHHKAFESREQFDRAMHDTIQEHGAQLVCMAGFMRLLTPWFVEQWYNKLINIHPSLLPAFKGIDAQKQALAYGVKVSGCTVHFVRAEMDNGPIILQETVPIYHNDTEASASARILETEHQCYPRALKLIAEGKISIKDGIVYVND